MERSKVIGLVVVALAVVGALVVLLVTIGGDTTPPKPHQVTQKESFCSYATKTNGSGLLKLTADERVPEVLFIARGYLPAAPKNLRPDLKQLVNHIAAMDSREGVQVPNPEAVATARRVDRGIAVYCKGVKTS